MEGFKRVKLVDTFLDKGLAYPNLWGNVTVDEDEKDNKVKTNYDVALKELGFSEYIKNKLNIKDKKLSVKGNKPTYHEIYITMLVDIIGFEKLTNHEKSIYKTIIENETRPELKSTEYQKLKENYKDRKVESRKVKENFLTAVPQLLKNGEEGDFISHAEEFESELLYIMKISNLKKKKKPTIQVLGYDKTVIDELGVTGVDLPILGHIHPKIVSRITTIIPELNRKGITIFSLADKEKLSDDIFELLFFLYLETMLTKNCNSIREYLEPYITIGRVFSNMNVVMYAIGETAGEKEKFYFNFFRYSPEVRIIGDRSTYDKILKLKGLGVNDDGVATTNGGSSTVFSQIHYGAYSPKNGNLNDVREDNTEQKI